MATYAIGDIQGCGGALERLIDKLNIDPASDTLWFAGDIVNRGPSSLKALKTVMELGDNAITILGNHDFHLLQVMAGIRKPAAKDTLDDILESAECDDYFHWLRRQPLLHRDNKLGVTMTHAGIYPLWDLREAMLRAKELEQVLRGTDYLHFLESLPGKSPVLWDDALEGIERLRFIVAAFTRMRYCKNNGALEFDFKGPPANAPEELHPWYRTPGRLSISDRLVFGHWASHGEGDNNYPDVIPLDFGCVWGGRLVALNLESGEKSEVDCSSNK